MSFLKLITSRYVCSICRRSPSTFRLLPVPSTSLLGARYSTDTASAPIESTLSPPFLSNIRQDLKTAMRNRDSSRLPVLRALLSDITNASKTAQPIATDKQLQKRMRKRAKACLDAAAQFEKAQRMDLKQKEEAEAAMLEEYAAMITVETKEDKIVETA